MDERRLLKRALIGTAVVCGLWLAGNLFLPGRYVWVQPELQIDRVTGSLWIVTNADSFFVKAPVTYNPWRRSFRLMAKSTANITLAQESSGRAWTLRHGPWWEEITR